MWGEIKKNVRRYLIHLYESSREAQKARENITTEVLGTSIKIPEKNEKHV